MAEVTFDFGEPALTDANDSDDYTLAVEFQMGGAYPIPGVEWRVPDTLPSGTCAIALWNASTSALLASKDITPDPGDAGQLVRYYFDTPYDGAADTAYRASVYTPDRYTATTGYAWPHTDGPLTASAANGWLSGSAAFPGGQSGNAANFHVSPIVEVPDDAPAGTAAFTVALTVAAAGERESAGSAAAAISLTVTAVGSTSTTPAGSTPTVTAGRASTAAVAGGTSSPSATARRTSSPEVTHG